LAAAGLYALEHNISRLKQDHDHAMRLGRVLHTMRGITINPAEVETNIVIFDVAGTGMDASEVVDRIKRQGVLMLPISQTRVRAVTHLDVSEEDIDRAISAFGDGLS
jgi:threonine aldolase